MYVARQKLLYLLLMAINSCVEVLSLDINANVINPVCTNKSTIGCHQSIATDLMEIVMVIVATASTQHSCSLSL